MRRLLFVLMVLAVVLYGVFESRRLVEGPSITIDTPRDGSATSSQVIVIAGTARNISFLTINAAPAYTDEQGHFREVFTPPLGYTVLTVTAKDRFGRTRSASVRITVLNYCRA
jgi:hypothetical protein